MEDHLTKDGDIKFDALNTNTSTMLYMDTSNNLEQNSPK